METVNNLAKSDYKDNYTVMTEEIKKGMEKFNRVFIEAGMAKELSLESDGHSLALNPNSYAEFADEDKAYVEEILSASKKSEDVKSLETVFVKDWKVWFTYDEVCTTFSAVVAIGPAAVVAALEAICSVVPGIGNAIAAIIGIIGGFAITASITYSITHHRGWWMGIDEWHPSCGSWA